MVAGNYRDALKSIHAVRQLRVAKDDPEAATVYLVHEIFSEGMLKQGVSGTGFDAAFKQEFHDTYGGLYNRKTIELEWLLPRAEADQATSAAKASDAGNVDMAAALDLVRRYQFVQVDRAGFCPWPNLPADDQAATYVEVPVCVESNHMMFMRMLLINIETQKKYPASAWAKAG